MITRFFSAMGFFGRGWRFAFAERRLSPWVLMPALITTAVTVGGGAAAWHLLRGWLGAHAGGHGAVVGALVWLAVLLVALAAAYVLYVASCVLATSPFSGLLSERAEQLATGAPPEPAGLGRALLLSLRGAGQALLGVTLYLSIAVPLFLLHWLVPTAAPLVWVASLLQAALFFAFDAFYEPLHRRGAGFFAKWRFIGAHLAESLGFGMAVALTMMVPLVSVVVTPVAVVGGTLLFLELDKPGAAK
jgi:CysZ protein